MTASSSSEPYLSLVATARNDDHGGGLLRRMQAFVTGWLAQCRRFDLPAELILVEWNPPADRPRLAEALDLRGADDGPCAVRIIEVPADLHRRFDHAPALPLFQMIAKNVGIRRARGRFVLATNIDLLFSDGLMQTLARRNLRDDRMYRADRWDVEAEIPLDLSVEAQLRWCGTHVIRVNRYQSTDNLRTGDCHRNYWPLIWRVRLLEAMQDLRLVPAVTRKRLHLNACGDFTLMSRQRWAALRGYPEWPIFSMHLDSLLCTAAHWSGAREAILPDPVYHIEHGTGSGWTPEGRKQLADRVKQLGVPMLTDLEFNRMCVHMRRDRKAMGWNEEAWGLAGEELVEMAMGIGQAAPAAGV